MPICVLVVDKIAVIGDQTFALFHFNESNTQYSLRQIYTSGYKSIYCSLSHWKRHTHIIYMYIFIWMHTFHLSWPKFNIVAVKESHSFFLYIHINIRCIVDMMRLNRLINSNKPIGTLTKQPTSFSSNICKTWAMEFPEWCRQ